MSDPYASVVIVRDKEKEMNELELEIATELAAMGTELEGSAFWAEVSRLLTFGDEWWEQV
jgi:hypothetical protein